MRSITFSLLCLSFVGISFAWIRHEDAIPKNIVMDPSVLTEEDWAIIEEENKRTPASTRSQRFPGYKRGTQYMGKECGVKGKSARITGGEETTPHEYPWMAGLFFVASDGKTYFCGGTVISKKFILTAGHCADGIQSMEVILGAHEIKNRNEATQRRFKAANWFVHPEYSSTRIHNDIALIELSDEITFDENIRPICLPSYTDQGEDFANIQCPAVGWGRPSDKINHISEVLREVETETITNMRCFFQLPTITKGNICISGHKKRSTCNGDSGGPLHYVMEDSRLKQIGITSFGLAAGCELGLHAAFTRVTYYLEFIETVSDVQIDS